MAGELRGVTARSERTVTLSEPYEYECVSASRHKPKSCVREILEG